MNEIVQSKETLPALAQPRLPYHSIFQDRFGVDRAMWKALVEAVWPLAETPESIALALAYCQAKNRDPFKRVVHIVPMWNSALRKTVETVWPSIADHRITASRTGEYAGADPTSFGDWRERTFSGLDHRDKKHEVTMCFPEWAQMTVYRVVKGVRVAFPGPRCYFTEYFSGIGDTGVPNSKWQRSPAQMLEKCAEAQALRRGFPEELGSEATAEEMEGKIIDQGGVEIPSQTLLPPKPKGKSEFERTEAAGKAETAKPAQGSDTKPKAAAPAGREASQPKEADKPKATEAPKETPKEPEKPKDPAKPKDVYCVGCGEFYAIQPEHCAKCGVDEFDPTKPEPRPAAGKVETKELVEQAKAPEQTAEQELANWYKDQIAELANCKAYKDIVELRDVVNANVTEDIAADFRKLASARAQAILLAELEACKGVKDVTDLRKVYQSVLSPEFFKWFDKVATDRQRVFLDATRKKK